MKGGYIPIELVGPRPPCFSRHEWDVWVAGEIAADSSDQDGFCGACTPWYAREMRNEGRCRYPATAFIATGAGDDSNDIAGIRYPGDTGPAITPAPKELSDAVKLRLEPLIELIRPAPISNIRVQLIAAKAAGKDGHAI